MAVIMYSLVVFCTNDYSENVYLKYESISVLFSNLKSMNHS